MVDITSRQVNILKAIVEEFIEAAKPVGSETLEKKYNFGVCPATLRNEMSKLTQMGYLQKSHSSAGRAPTSMGLKYYVRELMSPRKLSVSEEVGVKEKIWDFQHDFAALLREATKELSRRSRRMALATTSQGSLFFAGVANLLDEPEFWDIDVARFTLRLIDDPDFWLRITESIFSSSQEEEMPHLLIGHDLGEEFLESCGMIFQDYESGPYRGIIGVIGPARQRYNEVFPLINYFAQLLSEVGR